VKGDIQELGRPEILLTEREPEGGTGIEKPPARGEDIGATGAKSDVEVRYRSARRKAKAPETGFRSRSGP